MVGCQAVDCPEEGSLEVEFVAAVAVVVRASLADSAAHTGQVGSLVARQMVGRSLQKPQ